MPDCPPRTSIPVLRSVRFRDGRPSLRVLRQPPPPDPLYTDAAAALREVVQIIRAPLAGFVVVFWAADGGAVAHYTNTDASPLWPSMIPAFCHDMVANAIADRGA